MTTQEILQRAVKAKNASAFLTAEIKNKALYAMADELVAQAKNILQANEQDVESAKGTISDVMLDRLRLTEKRIEDMAEGIRHVAELPDYTGRMLDEYIREDGLCIQKISVPLGVVAIIYESRPNVTSDAAALCLKSGNVCVLRSGKEAHASSQAIVNAMQDGLKQVGLSVDFINLIRDTSRASATELMQAVGFVDVLIPRGGAGLIRACVENAKVPCIQTGTGICHIFVDESADLDMALRIIENAKTSRPSVCNAMEVCLVHKNIAQEFLPKLWQKLVLNREEHPVSLQLDEPSYAILRDKQNCFPANETDFDMEFLDYKMAVKVVDDTVSAVEHIAKHSTHHSEAIVTRSDENARLFTLAVDSAAVYVNASTRFTDGGEFGLGCEMGISTQKLHARGPMGLQELTTYKYVVKGDGHIR